MSLSSDVLSCYHNTAIMSDKRSENPPTGLILKNHELASRIINQHNTELAILDHNELAALKCFVMDPSPDNQNRVLFDYCGTIDPQGTREEDIGKSGSEKFGSLVAYVVARYGRVENDHNTPEEVQMLREWFENGGGEYSKL